MSKPTDSSIVYSIPDFAAASSGISKILKKIFLINYFFLNGNGEWRSRRRCQGPVVSQSVLLAVGELSRGMVSGTSQDAGLAVPAIRKSIGVDPGEYERHAIS